MKIKGDTGQQDESLSFSLILLLFTLLVETTPSEAVLGHLGTSVHVMSVEWAQLTHHSQCAAHCSPVFDVGSSRAAFFRTNCTLSTAGLGIQGPISLAQQAHWSNPRCLSPESMPWWLSFRKESSVWKLSVGVSLDEGVLVGGLKGVVGGA